MTMEKFAGERFIKTVLIDNIQQMIDKGFDYLAFVIIGQGVELLGSFFDDKPFDHYERGLPRERFRKGISLMDSKYHILDDFLWTNLRCGLAHQLKPKNEITLTSYQSKAIDLVNLYKGNETGLTYIVVDTLFADFKIACNKVIEILQDESNPLITDEKRQKIHLTVRQTELHINTETGEIKEIFN